MPYCPLCGTCCQTNDSVCTGCGSEFVLEGEKVTGTLTGGPVKFNKDVVNERRNPKPEFDQNLECQLGKGLIKPNSVELENDGFHFKYDKPAHHFVKAGNFSDKAVEFRLACPDPAGVEATHDDTLLEEGVTGNGTDQKDTLPENTSVEITPEYKRAEAVDSNVVDAASPIEAPANIDTIGTETENVPKPLEREIWAAGEISAETPAVAPEETDATFTPELLEPELKTATDTEILWEDFQRWLGIPLTNQYRISNRSVQIIERVARKFSEVELTLISEVKLKQSWLDKLLRTGDLYISVKHLPESRLVLSGVHNPGKVRQLLDGLINSAL